MKTLAAAAACAVAFAAAPARGASYAIDFTHSFASFEVLHLGLSTSRGRFDKSEPTVYGGSDLDVPTYIRRNVSLVDFPSLS